MRSSYVFKVLHGNIKVLAGVELALLTASLLVGIHATRTGDTPFRVAMGFFISAMICLGVITAVDFYTRMYATMIPGKLSREGVTTLTARGVMIRKIGRRSELMPPKGSYPTFHPDDRLIVLHNSKDDPTAVLFRIEDNYVVVSSSYKVTLIERESQITGDIYDSQGSGYTIWSEMFPVAAPGDLENTKDALARAAVDEVIKMCRQSLINRFFGTLEEVSD